MASISLTTSLFYLISIVIFPSCSLQATPMFFMTFESLTSLLLLSAFLNRFVFSLSFSLTACIPLQLLIPTQDLWVAVCFCFRFGFPFFSNCWYSIWWLLLSQILVLLLLIFHLDLELPELTIHVYPFLDLGVPFQRSSRLMSSLK